MLPSWSVGGALMGLHLRGFDSGSRALSTDEPWNSLEFVGIRWFHAPTQKRKHISYLSVVCIVACFIVFGLHKLLGDCDSMTSWVKLSLCQGLVSWWLAPPPIAWQRRRRTSCRPVAQGVEPGATLPVAVLSVIGYPSASIDYNQGIPFNIIQPIHDAQ